ncbi:helix-turn-helix transcriptional regulator [Egicoccus halophilus]|uniref:DeoR family transcriptional regulator n=1 Tax=Egicoccus halophilus TaxID=1670830 RepID=A0A8J3ACD7_9ACTN|nr:YafY family protein [Egicoccus halophilus]GGI08512.1 DeoR family transcriptional regulator [Egicoccus halophilus]
METATRLLRLLALLHTRATWTAPELAERLGVTTRTVRRDIARLRRLDHPVQASPGPHGGYQLGRGPELPPLVLDDREALAAVVGLRFATAGTGVGLAEAAVSALAKLERVLPDHLAERLQDVQAATVALASGPGVATDPDCLVVLAQACRRRERIRLMYRDREGTRSLRHLEPLRLVHAHWRWYLVAFDLDRDDWRTFRVDRAHAPMATGVRSVERDGPDPVDLVRAAMSVAPYDLRAIVRLHLPLAEAEATSAARFGLLEADGDTTLLRTGGNDPAWLAGYLAGLPCRVEVLEPVEVRDALRRHVERLLGADGPVPA